MLTFQVSFSISKSAPPHVVVVLLPLALSLRDRRNSEHLLEHVLAVNLLHSDRLSTLHAPRPFGSVGVRLVLLLRNWLPCVGMSARLWLHRGSKLCLHCGPALSLNCGPALTGGGCGCGRCCLQTSTPE